MNLKNNKLKSRRGLSSIVGGLLFVILMVATFAVLGVALNSQTSTNYLVVDVKNDGQNHVEIANIVITNQTQAPLFPTLIHDVPSDTSLIVSGDEQDVVKTMNLKLDTAVAPSVSEKYFIKVISSLGSIRTGIVECDQSSCQVVSGEGSVSATMILEGSTGVNTQQVAAILFVSNNSDETITQLKPTKGFTTPLCDDLWTADATGATETLFTEDILNCTPLPGVAQPLGPHETMLFRWTGTVSGDIGSTFTFCSSVEGNDAGGPIDEPPESCATLTIIDPNSCGGCGEGEGGETIILIDDLLIRPSIFLTIPSPFGNIDNDDTGLWGVNIANPTDEAMQISKVTILGYPPGGTAQFNVFDAEGGGAQVANNCNIEDIEPNTGTQPQGYWNCPSDNVMMWQSVANPIDIPANSTKSFIARVTPDSIKDDKTHLDALIVQANVYSTFGSFGKAGYQSTMYSAQSPIVNVYLTNSTADINDRDFYISNMNDIANYTSVRFDAVLADMDTYPATVIDSNARFIINVPREWEFINFISCDGFDDVEDGDCADANMPSVTVHSDGSTQIIGITQGEIGDGVNDARKIAFNARSAPVEVPRLYVMYILADGFSTHSDFTKKSIGPLSEVVLNVDP
jgi:hypothetical protein